MTFADADPGTATSRDRLAAIPLDDKGGTWQGRRHQDIAVSRVVEAIAAGPGLPSLTIALTLATGKTFIALQRAWKLFQSRWNLADRNNLADQAYSTFSANPDDGLVRIEPRAGQPPIAQRTTALGAAKSGVDGLIASRFGRPPGLKFAART